MPFKTLLDSEVLKEGEDKPSVNNGDVQKERERDLCETLNLNNPHLKLMKEDILYHLGLSSKADDLPAMFGDVKFVVMGGTAKRVLHFAFYMIREINYSLPTGQTLLDISHDPNRYSMYKVGPILSVSHGMGIPSVDILLHEIIKLMYHAGAKDPIFFRIGTSGGIGIEEGTVVITSEAVDGMLQPYLQKQVLGNIVRHPAKFNQEVIQDLKSLVDSNDPYNIITGKTMCTTDFYEGQARLDGAFCDYDEEEKIQYFEKLRKAGIVNIEMESLSFAALTYRAGIKSAVVCVTIVNRLNCDQITAPNEVLQEWQDRPQKLIAKYIKQHLESRKS